MTTATRITVDDMKDRLLSLDQVREALSSTEPVGSLVVPVGDTVRFKFEPGWNQGIDAVAGDDLVDGFVTIGTSGAAKEYRLSKDALLEATSLCGLPKGYVQRTPSAFIEDQVNYWWRGGFGNKDYKALTVGDDSVKAFTRATINPFSNLRLLDQSLSAIESKYGSGEVLADYKFAHSLQRTHLRLVVPEYLRTMTGPGTVDDDNWSVGIQIKNSLIGMEQTSIDGYMFRWWCTNGAVDLGVSSGTWSRRSGGQGDEVYEWAKTAVDEVLGGLEHSLDQVQAMVDIPLQGEVNDVLRDIFAQYRLPAAYRQNVIEQMVEAEDLNMYTVMQAITQVANEAGMDPRQTEALMAIGGNLPSTAHERCGECHRIKPE